MQISYTETDTVLGKLRIAATDKGVCFLQIASSAAAFLEDIRGQYPKAEIAPASGNSKKQLTQWLDAINGYLGGKRVFPELPLDVKGTDFQLRIWKQLQKIPAGKLKSYKEIAVAAGMPKAVRAVASACARNNVALAIPCHRVVHSDGSISGYRWGVKRKQALIELEKLVG